jgi:hypothetical protein
VAQNTPNNIALEEVPPENTNKDMDLEKPLLTPHWFSDDHLHIIFDMKRMLDDQMYNHRILDQRMDLMFDALTYAPKRNVAQLADKILSQPITLMDIQVCILPRSPVVSLFLVLLLFKKNGSFPSSECMEYY